MLGLLPQVHEHAAANSGAFCLFTSGLTPLSAFTMPKLISSTMNHVQTACQVLADRSTKAVVYKCTWDKLMEYVVRMAVCTLC